MSRFITIFKEKFVKSTLLVAQDKWLSNKQTKKKRNRFVFNRYCIGAWEEIP